MKIGIIGQGILGKTHKEYLLKETDHEVFTFDINGDCNSTMEIIAKKCEFVFVCVPTDTGKDERLDMSIVNKIAKQLNDFKFMGGCVIRSTLRVGTTRNLAEKYKNIDFYFMPEFLTERFAREEFKKPHRELAIGVYSTEFKEMLITEFEKIHSAVPGFMWAVEYEEAEMLKIATNSFYAMKIIFADELSYICEKNEIDYEEVKNLLVMDKRIGSTEYDLSGRDVHFRIGQDGKYGFGGKCLPKDSLEFLKMRDCLSEGSCLMERVVEINNRIRKCNCVKKVENE